MKKIYINIASFFIAVALFTASGCEKILEENPRSSLAQTFFQTESGIIGGIAGSYERMRDAWGTEGFAAMCVAGTDDHLMGASASSTTLYTYNGIDKNCGSGYWGIAYQCINTLNGVLQFAPDVEMTEANRTLYMAQAKFLRAFYYFYLVQMFGDVPLHLTYITTASTADSRQPIADVYAQIITDLTEASTELPPIMPASSPFAGKAAFQGTAKYLLAKVYLTRGWSSAAQATDFTNAYTIAKNLIDNKATYGLDLWADYADNFKEGNDYGKESLFVVEHNTDTKYGEWVSQASGGRVNIMMSLFRGNYTLMNANYPATGGGGVLVRTVLYGRPYTRTMPNLNYIYNQAFAERYNDARYDKSFQSVWIANTAANSVTPRGTLVVGVDTAMWMPHYEVSAARIASFKGIILTPKGENGANKFTNNFYPALTKFNDITRTHMNDPSDRPLCLFRFSEVYLIAAEAAIKGGGTLQNAADMVNLVRTRAAYRSTYDAPQLAAAVAAMQVTTADMTVDFILDERTREFYGELQRWFDLVRTKKLVDRITLWNTEATPYVKADYMLRPIPVQSQIDMVTEGPSFPQNPGY
jgi:starch-binding outer membrane protein, SusD/RagB family